MYIKKLIKNVLDEYTVIKSKKDDPQNFKTKSK